MYGIFHRLKRLWKTKSFLWAFIKRDLKLRYAGSLLGIFWSILNPILLILLYIFVFSVILRVKLPASSRMENYNLFLLGGLIPWFYFQDAVLRASQSFIDLSNFIKKLPIPLIICPLTYCFSSLPIFFTGSFILAAYATFLGFSVKIFLLLLPLYIIFLLLFAFFLSVIFAFIVVYFRDFTQILSLLLTIFLFLTPIFYSPNMVPEKLQPFLLLNPLYAYLKSFRASLAGGNLSIIFKDLLIPFCYLSFLAILAFIFYKRLAPAIRDDL